MSIKNVAVLSVDGRSVNKVNTKSAHKQQQRIRARIAAHQCITCGQKLSVNSTNQKCPTCADIHKSHAVKSNAKSHFRNVAGLEFSDIKALSEYILTNCNLPRNRASALKRMMNAVKD